MIKKVKSNEQETATISLGEIKIPIHVGKYKQAVLLEDDNGKREVYFFAENNTFIGNCDGIRFEKRISSFSNRLVIDIVVKTGETLPNWKALTFRSGIDSYMASYPEWENQFFPTFMRCEKTHFWGYFSRMDGKLLAVACPDAVASWYNDYNRVYYDPENFDDPGHRVYTTSFVLFSSLKQPQRHPCRRLEPNRRYVFRFVFGLCDNFGELNDFYDSVLGIRLTEAKKWTLEKGEKIDFVREDGEYFLTNEHGNQIDLRSRLSESGRYYLVHKKNKKESCSVFFVRESVGEYLRLGALAAMKSEQFASANCETYYGFFAVFAYLAKFSDKELERRSREKLEEFLHTILNEKGDDLKEEADPFRIQNYTTIISILTLAYKAIKEEKYLDTAVLLAEKFVTHQGEDGAYYSHNTHYTCVIYPAKSLFELCDALNNAERPFEKIFASAMRACENLLRLMTDIGTEGEHTFEDGMISCEALQLALAGLLSNGEKREKYTTAAKKILRQHACLEVNFAPDARYRGCTLRHWEAHYDVLISRNMMTAPHGWTSWKTYAQYYLYELTNDPFYLTNYFDTLGACLQVCDWENEDVNWAFVIDPCVEARRFVKNGERSGCLKEDVFGEEYLPRISQWWRADPKIVSIGYGDPRFGKIEGRARGACCDNDVFEHFKCLYETGMHAVAHETDDGWIAYNCTVNEDGISVTDKHVDKIRIFVKQAGIVCVNGKEYRLEKGTHYLSNENYSGIDRGKNK